MHGTATTFHQALGLMVPGLALAGLLGVVSVQLGAISLPASSAAAIAKPETVTIAPRPFAYRAAGDYQRDGHPVDGPLVQVASAAPLEIMAYQVSAADYAICVAAGACQPAEPRRHGRGDVPVTGVSFRDATDYALWLSAATGETWRLPSLEEWAFAAGSRAVDHALAVDTDAANPAERWLAFYEKESALGSAALAVPTPRGSFGANEFGVYDVSGTVWEWTSTCASRVSLDTADRVVSRVESCGVRFLEGKHRTPMSGFVRDAIGGGCSVGAPPDNLGFRLVHERGWLARLLDPFARLFA